MHSIAFFLVSFITSFLTTQATSYIIIESPVPYSNNILNNSPLNISSSDYPYKQRLGIYTILQINNIKVRDLQPLTFFKNAVYGKGSC